MFLGRLRQILADVNDADVRGREHLPHPFIAQMAGDRLAFERAHQDGEVPAILPRELDQELMPAVRGQELPKDKPAAAAELGWRRR